MTQWRIILACLTCFAVTLVDSAQGQDTQIGLAQSLPTETLTITSGRGRQQNFQVELARTEEQQQIGLMWRQSLAENAGMLFIFSHPQRASFWMRNTYIPLDMLFIRSDGTIANIIANTRPLTLDPQLSKGDVLWVLELAGGVANKKGIKPGDHVEIKSHR